MTLLNRNIEEELEGITENLHVRELFLFLRNVCNSDGVSTKEITSRTGIVQHTVNKYLKLLEEYSIICSTFGNYREKRYKVNTNERVDEFTKIVSEYI